MTVISEQWANLLDPVVKEWFYQGYSRRASLIETLYRVQGSSRADEKISGAGAIGIDAWEQYEKTRHVPQVDMEQGYQTTFTHSQYIVDLPVEKKLIDDAQDAQVLNSSERLGDSTSLKREVDAASVFNNAFSGSYLGGDGVALCSDSHPLSPSKSGSTQDNNGTLALTKANVKTVREAMMAYTDDNGNKVAVTPNTILVPPGLEDDALEITKSLLDPSSANNTINPQAGRFNVLVWHYLTDSNAWFMIDSMLMKMSLLWFNRDPVDIHLRLGDDPTVMVFWRAYMRYSFGWTDWRWVYGNNPS
jgi:hypothetical protein